MISLGLGDQETKLESIFQRNYQPEVFKDENCLWCERCKKKCPASKRTRIIQAPQVLIVTLKRFEFDAAIGNIKKIEREIEYQHTALNLPLQVSEVAVKMELYAVIVSLRHQCQKGSITNGHYYALLKNPEGQWLCCNDDRVTHIDSPVTSADQHDKNAYILFYKKTNITLTQSEMFAPVKMNENSSLVFNAEGPGPKEQVAEGEAIVCSRVFMDENQFSRGLRIERAPTTYVKSNTRVENSN